MGQRAFHADSESGERIEAYIFNRQSGAAPEGNAGRVVCAVLYADDATDADYAKASYAEIARLEFTGKDRAAGKHWEDWVEKYNDEEGGRSGEEHCWWLVPDAAAE